VPNLTFIATANAVMMAGGKPIFCEVDENTLCIDVNKIENLITDKTKVIIPVHLYGNACEMVSIIEIAKKHNLISKEHNGDYIPVSIIKEKFDLGLDSINIAPEFGLIETQTYINEIGNSDLFDRYWQICYDSKKWVKWVNSEFDPYTNKKELVKICGHYVLSYPEFISDIKSQFPDIDKKIKINVTKKLNELYGY
jgi:hypothetical protein